MPSEKNWNGYFADCKSEANGFPSTVTVSRERYDNEREALESAAALQGYKLSYTSDLRVSFLHSHAK